MLQPVGDAVSKDGINRAERGGKDEEGSFPGPGGSLAAPVASAGEGVIGGAKTAGGYLGGMFGGGKK